RSTRGARALVEPGATRIRRQLTGRGRRCVHRRIGDRGCGATVQRFAGRRFIGSPGTIQLARARRDSKTLVARRAGVLGRCAVGRAVGEAHATIDRVRQRAAVDQLARPQARTRVNLAVAVIVQT
ncbi:MAG: hypothetical protein ACK559_36385, partial [bacterium]